MSSWEFAFSFFHYLCVHLKETIPSSSITWSEMGKQNIQAKEVYCVDKPEKFRRKRGLNQQFRDARAVPYPIEL